VPTPVVVLAVASDGLRHTPTLTVLLELMQMDIGPAHGGLKCGVKAAQLDGTRHLESAPDRSGQAQERDLQFVGRQRRHT